MFGRETVVWKLLIWGLNRHVWSEILIAISFKVQVQRKYCRRQNVSWPTLVCCFIPRCRHLWCVVSCQDPDTFGVLYVLNYRHLWCVVSCQPRPRHFGVLFHAKAQTPLLSCFMLIQGQDTCVASSRMDHFCQRHSNTICVLFLVGCGGMGVGCTRTCTSVHV